jgi:hypothetical protein
MSDTIWLQVNRARGPEGGEQDNSIMLSLGRQLDGLADDLGVTRLSAFRDYSAVDEFLEDEVAEEALPDGAPRGSWFDAKEGYTAVRRLLDELRARPERLRFKPDPSQSHWIGYLLDELSYCADQLKSAAEQGHQFRFLVVP